MTRNRKIILIICGILLVCVGGLAGIAVYLYTHPSRIKALVERTLSDATGASVSLSRLTYAVHPFHIGAEGLSVTPGERLQGVYLKAPDFRLDLSLKGQFGHKTLVVKRLEVREFSCRILKDAALPALSEQPEHSSLLGAIIKPLVALLVFRDITFEQADLSGGTLTLSTGDHILQATQFKARLDAHHQVALSCHMEARWPAQQMHLLIPKIQATTDPVLSWMNPHIQGAVAFDEAVFESPLVEVSDSQGGTTFLYRHDLKDVKFEDLALTFQTVHMKHGGRVDTVPLDLHLKGEGTLSTKEDQLTLRPLHLILNDDLRLAGGMSATIGRQNKISLEVQKCRIVPERLLALLPSGIGLRKIPVNLEGPVHLTGKGSAVEARENWVWNGDFQARLKQNAVSLTADYATISGEVSGRIRARGQIPDVKVSATVNADHITASGDNIDLESSKAHFTFSGAYPVFHLRDLSIRIPRASPSFKNQKYAVNDIHLKTAQGRINMVTQAVSLPEIQFNSSLLNHLMVSLESGGDQMEINIQGKDTGLAGLAGTLDFVPTGWEVSGPDALQVRAWIDAARNITVTADVAFPETGFHNGESTILGDKVSIKGTVQGEIDPSGRIFTDASLNADGGEVLVDRFYVNLKQSPFSTHVKGTYRMPEQDLKLSPLLFGLKGILTCRVAGHIRKKDPDWQFDLSTHIPGTPLKPLFRLFIVEPFQVGKPFLGTIHAGGQVSAKATLKGTGSDWTAKGDFSWKDGTFLSEDKGISFKGIDLFLPLWVRRHDTEVPPEILEGSASIQAARVPLLPEQALAFPLAAVPNGLSIDSPVVIEVPGGDVRIGAVKIRDLTGPSPHVTTRLFMDQLNIEPLLSDIWPHPIAGTLSGTLDPVHMKNRRLTSTGDITAKVVDGEVIISDIDVSGLFTGTPVFKLDARWKDLNLSKLTSGTAFGEIEGVLNGYAKDLEVAQGQPQKFDLFLETVKTDRIPQRISVKAVENIAQLGSGQSPFVGAAGIFASLFKEFPYEKIGVHATLENDVFKINGTIHEDGKEYLIKRGLFSGVNVINQNPDNRVSFKDMLKRLKRVTSSSGPVVK